MLLSMQTLVRRWFHPLAMLMIAGGFLLLLVELIIYQHFVSFQLVGTGSVILGLIASLLGIRARARLRSGLIILFLVLSLSGVLGVWFHNLERLGIMEGEDRPPAGNGAPGEEGPAERPGFVGRRMEPPVLASLSVSGLCVFGAMMLLSKRDDE